MFSIFKPATVLVSGSFFLGDHGPAVVGPAQALDAQLRLAAAFGVVGVVHEPVADDVLVTGAFPACAAGQQRGAAGVHQSLAVAVEEGAFDAFGTAHANVVGAVGA